MNTFCRILLFWLLLAGNVYAAKNPTTWPYGGTPVANEGMGKPSIIFTDSTNFGETSPHFFRAHFINADFDEALFIKEIRFMADFDRNTGFYGAEFRKSANFSGVHFNGDTSFNQAQFQFTTISRVDVAASFVGTKFAKDANFGSTLFAGKVWFMDAKFAGDADFRDANFLRDVDFSHTAPKDYTKSPTVFKKQANFMSVIFNGYTNFSLTQFEQNANFSNATFSRMANFSDATFSGYANFENCQFSHKVNFAGTQFIPGVDLRRADFSKSVSILFDHHTSFPNNKLNVNWNQIKGRLHLSEESCINASPWQMVKREYRELDSLYNRVAHKKISDTPDTLAIKRQNIKARLDSLTQVFNKERYDLTEIFYLRLRDNYLAQNDKASADAVTYELAERKAEILNEPLWILYGWIMGWGYKPVQFLLAAFLLVALPFALFWYRRYYHLVLPMVDHAIDDAFKEQLKAPEKLNKKNHFNHAAIAGEIIFPARVWHVIFFSTSVLLGIRFKKEWIEKKDRAFLWWVTAEWLIGIGLYILFAVLVKSNEFSYVKGLLGLS